MDDDNEFKKLNFENKSKLLITFNIQLYLIICLKQ